VEVSVEEEMISWARKKDLSQSESESPGIHEGNYDGGCLPNREGGPRQRGTSRPAKSAIVLSKYRTRM
jgi:hypothetical protein